MVCEQLGFIGGAWSTITTPTAYGPPGPVLLVRARACMWRRSAETCARVCASVSACAHAHVSARACVHALFPSSNRQHAVGHQSFLVHRSTPLLAPCLYPRSSSITRSHTHTHTPCRAEQDTVFCGANATRLDECTHDPWYQTDCDNTEDVVVACGEAAAALQMCREACGSHAIGRPVGSTLLPCGAPLWG